MTNGERPRQMTDEELARWISESIDCGTCPILDDDFENCDYNCMDNVMEWLKQESEDTE